MAEEHQNEYNGWLVIVNPNAGSRKGEKDWPLIRKLLMHSDFSFKAVMTEYRGHAITLVSTHLAEGFRKIIVVGGDGTLNEALNGVFSQTLVPAAEVILAMIPIGTGNDWCRMFGIDFEYENAVRQISAGKTFTQDVGKVSFFQEEKPETRYFMNVAGIGYDALVAKKTNIQKEKGKGNSLTYLWFVFAGLFQYRFMDGVIDIDGKNVFKGEVFSMNVGICRYNGGGMMQVPYAIPDDGLLDVTLIKKVSKWLVIRYAHKLYNGTLTELPFVKTFKGRTIRIRSTGQLFLETDGESLGHTPFTFEVLPGSINVICGEKVMW